MSPFNAYYGCFVCLAPGNYSNVHHKMTFPIETFELCSLHSHEHHVKQSLRSGEITCGVRGSCSLAPILDVPNSVSLDSMHLLYLGITKTLVEYILKIKALDVECVSKIMCEWRSFLLYYGPISLYLSNASFDVFLISLLLTAVHLLSTLAISSSDLEDSHTLILHFQKCMVNTFGDRCQTYSIHALSHLKDQVIKFSPLWSFSAFLFESAFGKLISFVKGTRNEAHQIVKHFICHKRLLYLQSNDKYIVCDNFNVMANHVSSNISSELLKMY